jgi:hypothetical protein
MHSAGATRSHTASVLGAGEAQQVTQCPEQRHIGIGFDAALTAIHNEDIGWHTDSAPGFGTGFG